MCHLWETHQISFIPVNKTKITSGDIKHQKYKSDKEVIMKINKNKQLVDAQ